MARLLSWFCSTRLGCRFAGHPLKRFVAGMDVVWCPCGERRVTGAEIGRDPELEAQVTWTGWEY